MTSNQGPAKGPDATTNTALIIPQPADSAAQVEETQRLVDGLNSADHADEPDTLKAQLSRRRDAAWRLQPMADFHGRRAG